LSRKKFAIKLKFR